MAGPFETPRLIRGTAWPWGGVLLGRLGGAWSGGRGPWLEAPWGRGCWGPWSGGVPDRDPTPDAPPPAGPRRFNPGAAGRPERASDWPREATSTEAAGEAEAAAQINLSEVPWGEKCNAPTSNVRTPGMTPPHPGLRGRAGPRNPAPPKEAREPPALSKRMSAWASQRQTPSAVWFWAPFHAKLTSGDSGQGGGFRGAGNGWGGGYGEASWDGNVLCADWDGGHMAVHSR